MFFNRRKRYNGDVSALLAAFGFDMQESGIMKTLGILDHAWADNYSRLCRSVSHHLYSIRLIWRPALSLSLAYAMYQ